MNRLEELLFRWSEDTLSPAELDELLEYLETPQGRRVLVEQFHYAETVSSALWDKFSTCQKKDKLKTYPTKRWAIGLSLTAAAAVLLLWVGSLLWRPADLPLPVPQENFHQVVDGRVLIDGGDAKAIPEGSEIHVPDDAPAVLHLADGSRAEFEPGSRAVVHGPLLELRQMIELIEGSGSFTVEKGDGQFQVETRLGRVTALGTEFKVRIMPGERLGVNVRTGMVSVEIGRETHLMSGPNNRIFAAGKRRPHEVRGFLAGLAPDQLTLKRRDQHEDDYRLVSNVAVLMDGKPAAMSDLAEGMIIFLELADDENAVVRIRAEGPTSSGDVQALDIADGKITVAARRAGREDTTRTFPLAPDVQAWRDGNALELAAIPLGVPVLLKMSADRRSVIEIILSDEQRPPAPRTPRKR